MNVSGLHLVEQGKGFPILLGHGLCLDHEMWAPQIPALAKHFRVLALDFRGHGGSDLPDEGCTLESFTQDVLRVADSLKLRRFGYAGLSMGGMVGMRLALAAPDRVAALALLDTDAEPDPRDTLEAYRRYLEVFRKKGPTALSVGKQLTHFLTPKFSKEHPEAMEGLRKRLLSNDRTAVYRASSAVFNRASVLKRLTALDIPTLVLAGTEDVVMPPERAQKIHRAISGSAYVEIPDCGHLATLVQPEHVTRELLSFFQRTLS